MAGWRRLTARAPATSANLGPAFDAAGLALDWWDDLEVVADPGLPGTVMEVEGAGLPTGPDNLVRRAMAWLAEREGAELPPLRLRFVKSFPLGRGFGSSAAAVVLGLLAARELLGPDGGDLLGPASELEGHPDNVAACLDGGATLAWRDASGAHRRRTAVHPDLVALCLVAPEPQETAAARRLLPAEVPFAAAAQGAGRAALLPVALAGDFDLLLAATEDVLHQRERLAAVPEAAEALAALRGAGHAAVVSGAGPSLVVLGPRAALPDAAAVAEGVLGEGWRLRPVEIARVGASIMSREAPST